MVLDLSQHLRVYLEGDPLRGLTILVLKALGVELGQEEDGPIEYALQVFSPLELYVEKVLGHLGIGICVIGVVA